ncbi:MAG: hypothetical protein RL318_412 [Fibrobacterota bacterium]|jgi:hypothetical protein
MRCLVLGALVVLCGCAERDNPWDPVNRQGQEEIPQAKLPVPGLTSKVVLPDSSNRDPDNPYFANIQSALRAVEPGDTVWIQGGRDYPLTNGLEMVQGGSAYRWVVLRSFQGEARLVDARPGTISALLTLTGPGYVQIQGLAFVLCKSAGFRANGLQGPLRIDSCRFDSNGTYGLEMRGLRREIVLRTLQLRGNGFKPPLSVDSPVDSQGVHFE